MDDQPLKDLIQSINVSGCKIVSFNHTEHGEEDVFYVIYELTDLNDNILKHYIASYLLLHDDDGLFTNLFKCVLNDVRSWHNWTSDLDGLRVKTKELLSGHFNIVVDGVHLKRSV